MNCFFQKIVSKKQLGQALAFFSTTFCQHQLLPTSIIINSRAKDYFFTNKKLITIYKKY